MRRDILIDENDDLLIENTENPIFSVGEYEGESEGASVMAVRLMSLGDLNLDPDRKGDLRLDTFAKAEEGFAGPNPLLVYFYFIGSRGERLTSPKLPILSDKGAVLNLQSLREVDEIGFSVRFQRNVGVTYKGYVGAFVASAVEQGDFAIDVSISQNEKMLLVADKGNILEHPLRGVGAIQELNSNIDRDTMRDKVMREFEKDELLVGEFDIDRQTGLISIKSGELFDNGEE